MTTIHAEKQARLFAEPNAASLPSRVKAVARVETPLGFYRELERLCSQEDCDRLISRSRGLLLGLREEEWMEFCLDFLFASDGAAAEHWIRSKVRPRPLDVADLALSLPPTPGGDRLFSLGLEARDLDLEGLEATIDSLKTRAEFYAEIGALEALGSVHRRLRALKFLAHLEELASNEWRLGEQRVET